jgi:hypothetical protein
MVKKQSPIKKKPMHNPGESIEYEIDTLILEKLVPYAIVVGMGVGLTVSAWLEWFFDIPPNPIQITSLTLIAIVISWYKFRL